MSLTITIEDIDEILDEIEEHEKQLESQRKKKPKTVPGLKTWIRNAWKSGSLCEVYSNLFGRWCQGKISKTFSDSRGEWLFIEYSYWMGCCKVLRHDKQAVRPLNKALTMYVYTYASIHQIPLDSLRLDMDEDEPTIKPKRKRKSDTRWHYIPVQYNPHFLHP
eukprot:2120_1